MDLSLRHRTAVICGSTQGIGLGIAHELARLGAQCILMARDGDRLIARTAELPTPEGQRHAFRVADFTDPRQVRLAIDTVTAETDVHILVNNTGGPAAGSAIEAKPRDYVNALAMHLGCAQAWTQACAPLMRQAGYGRVINVTSTSVSTPIKGLGVSNSVRAAMANWTRTLASELGKFGITVNNVMPGFTKTARLEALFKGKASRGGTTVDEVERDAINTIPAGRLADPRELALAMLFLASPAASYVNGVNFPVDGGRLAAQ